MKKLILIFTAVFLISFHPAFAQEKVEGHDHAHDHNTAAPADKATPVDPEAAKKLLIPADNDMVIGKPDAPITIIEYASLSCGHCATFHKETLPLLEEKYINDGKLKLIFRHFPLNAQALKASLLVECLDSNDRKQKFLKTLFKSLENWAYHQDFIEKLKLIAKIGGVSNEEFDQCMENKELEDKILNGRLEAGKILKVQSTPTLFLNGKKVTTRGDEELTKAIDELL